ncbi:MAG: hypothetical protein HYW89_00950 [Candidatus Sungiibacteriota bacterium]|uniref:Uncharacterized protein n=1 Tax=Candidatus Sungiibacteriota bacterium TaxID=2750080 RepID=A0A7T5RJZ6_9BACT|nr:MAG: hypothetical protein HYW89_00950 [Candidatus Sungbacteria bacterium]
MANYKAITNFEFFNSCPDTPPCRCQLIPTKIKLRYKIAGQPPVDVDRTSGSDAITDLTAEGWTFVPPPTIAEPESAAKSGDFESLELTYRVFASCTCEITGECRSKTLELSVHYQKGKSTPDPTITAHEGALFDCSGDLNQPTPTPLTPSASSDNGSRAEITFSVSLPCVGCGGGGCVVRFGVKYDYTMESDCFITTAVYGTALHPEVKMLQGLRDNILRKTRWGNMFFTEYFRAYDKFSPEIAEKIKTNPDIKEAVLWGIVQPWVNYLKLALRRPQKWNLDNLDHELKEYLETMRREMEEWLSVIKPPEDFYNMSNADIVDELSIALLVLRGETDAYLERLRKLGALPLSLSADQHKNLSKKLISGGYKLPQINKIISLATQHPESP